MRIVIDVFPGIAWGDYGEQIQIAVDKYNDQCPDAETLTVDIAKSDNLIHIYVSNKDIPISERTTLCETTQFNDSKLKEMLTQVGVSMLLSVLDKGKLGGLPALNNRRRGRND